MLAACLAFFAYLGVSSDEITAGVLFAGLALICGWYAYGNAIANILRSSTASAAPYLAFAADGITGLQHQAREAGGGAYLATRPNGDYVFAPPTAAVLVLAGPRAGKTSCVVIPALAAHPGPTVSTSTKTEVLTATLPARRQLGQAWFLDLQGTGAPAATRPLHWSPVTRAEDWHQAQLIAEAMTGAAIPNSDHGHWTERASALLACCLHAAANSAQGMRELSGWILRHDTDTPLAELPPDSIAADVLLGIKHTADRERSSIFSTTARVLRAYRSNIALAASENPNFDPHQFVNSHDTVYIAAPAHQQHLLAPLVVGLLTEIRLATYQHTARHGPPRAPMLFMLDECANIAPLPDLPAMLSEAGGQGLQTVVVLQDMSQARRLWKADADGMLTLFGAKAILSGIADTATLEQLSLLCGEYDRPIQTITNPRSSGLRSSGKNNSTESWTTRRERRLPADQIAQIPQGQALILIGPHWQLVPILPYHWHPTLSQVGAGNPDY
jgi:type IV secretion system protein VirD4